MLIKGLNAIFVMLALIFSGSFSVSLHAEEASPLTHTSKIFTHEVKGDCIVMEEPKECHYLVDIDTEWFEQNNKAYRPINQAIFKVIRSFVLPLHDNLGEYRDYGDINDYTAYMKLSQEAISSMSEYYEAHEAHMEIGVTVSLQTSKLLGIGFGANSYLGGAHGNYGIFSLFLNPQSGEEILFKDIVSKPDEFKKMAELFFRKEYEIPEGEDINYTGFSFKDDVFHLPKNITISKDEISLIYNPYEVASFADGMLSVDIPLSDAKKFLNSKYIE